MTPEATLEPQLDRRIRAGLALLLLLLLARGIPAQAQWLTQSIALKPGWNAVQLHVDPSHDTLANLIAADAANPILEVWLWSPPASTVQFVNGPQEPIGTGSQWVSWKRSASAASQLQRLVANAACLVRVATNGASYTWNLKGRPVPPAYQWNTTGLNLLGFPTVPTSPPSFDTFLLPAPDLRQNAEIYQYPGGELGSNNPARVFGLRTTPVQRGQAFWISSGSAYNRYFGPFEVALTGTRGVDFRESLGASSFRLRNLTSSNLVVTLRLVASESPPAGQPALSGTPPLLVRGNLNPTNLTYASTNLPVGGAVTWSLAGQGLPGSEAEVVLGLNRSALAGAPGAVSAGILRLTDSLGYAQVDVPVSATVSSQAGLWVGSAKVTQVGQYLETFQRDTSGNPVVSTNGQYIATGINTALAGVPRPYSLRLILHNPGAANANAQLLQRVYYGRNPQSNVVVATREAALSPQFLAEARRISSTHLPWTAANTGWAFDGKLASGAKLKTIVVDLHTDRVSNPFLHTYHPDHDNLDVTFKTELPRGSESYSIIRQILLTVTPPAGDFASLTAAGQTLAGDYEETITLQGLARAGNTSDSRAFSVRGTFSLNRLSEIPTLTLTP